MTTATRRAQQRAVFPPSSSVNPDRPGLCSLSEAEQLARAIVGRRVPFHTVELADDAEHATITSRQDHAVCRAICQTQEGLRRCIACYRAHLEEARRQNEPLLYECHAGLVNVMVPDGEAGRPRGALLIGRVLAKPITQRKRKQLAAVLRELGANTAAIDVGRAVPVVPKADLLLSALIARNLLELERLSLPKQPTRPSASALCSSARALRHQRICRQIQQIIERDYRQPLSSAQLAAAVNLTPNYLCSIFHETTGIRLGAYITAVRVEKSQQWLAQAGVHVKEAAYQAGFADPNYFAVVFKKITGLTPTQWRARHDEKVLRDGGSVATS